MLLKTASAEAISNAWRSESGTSVGTTCFRRERIVWMSAPKLSLPTIRPRTVAPARIAMTTASCSNCWLSIEGTVLGFQPFSKVFACLRRTQGRLGVCAQEMLFITRRHAPRLVVKHQPPREAILRGVANDGDGLR